MCVCVCMIFPNVLFYKNTHDSRYLHGNIKALELVIFKKEQSCRTFPDSCKNVMSDSSSCSEHKTSGSSPVTDTNRHPKIFESQIPTSLQPKKWVYIKVSTEGQKPGSLPFFYASCLGIESPQAQAVLKMCKKRPSLLPHGMIPVLRDLPHGLIRRPQLSSRGPLCYCLSIYLWR